MPLTRRLNEPGLRALLRSETKDIHQRLDDRVGGFSTIERYVDFVQRSLRFRASAEAACADYGAWSPQLLADDLRRDLDDLGVPVVPATGAGVSLPTSAAKLGGLYVLEGSALGARLLLRRAESLGLTGQYGARHLARQTSDATRWKRFVAVLDQNDEEPQNVLAGALAVFGYALDMYMEGVHDAA
jgi:heme oxygenase (biliverdin-IX-beta and delta-forming)